MLAGDWASARGEYEEILGRGVQDAGVLNNLANVLLELKDPRAVEVARQAQALDPRSAIVLDTLGWALASNGKADEALAILREARLRDPESLDIRFHLASVLASKGRTDEARVELRGVIDRVGRDRLAGDRLRLVGELGI